MSWDSEKLESAYQSRRPDPRHTNLAAKPIRFRKILSDAASIIERHPLLLAVPAGAILAFGIYFISASRGYFPDEGSFCTIAQGILHGRLPYRDLFNEKPPLQYFWTAAIMAVTHPTLSGARLASTLALIVLMSCILHGPAKQIRQPARLVIWMFLAFSVAMDMFAFNNTAESSLAVLFGLNALLLRRTASGGAPSNRTAATQGIISGLCIGFRLTTIVPALVLMFPPNKHFPKRAYCWGLMGGVLCWLGPLFALGIGRDFFYATVGFHLTNPSVMTYLRGPASVDLWAGFLWLLCLGWLTSLRAKNKNLLWLLLWLVTIAFAAFLRMDAFRLWPSTAAALVLIAQEEPANNLLKRIAPVAVASVAFLLLIAFHPKKFGAYLNISNAVKGATGAEDRVWVGPFEPLSYCLAERQPASRYYFILPWTAKEIVRRQIVADIMTTRPRLIVIDKGAVFGVTQLLPELFGIVAQRYHPLRTYGSTVFYERNIL